MRKGWMNLVGGWVVGWVVGGTVAGVFGLAGSASAFGQRDGGVAPPLPDEQLDFPVCRADWSDQIESMNGYRRSAVTSAWLRNGVRVHHLKIDEAAGTPVTKPGGVLVSISFFGGELLETSETRGVSFGACSAWDQLSVSRLSPARIPGALEGRDAHIEAVVGPDLIQLRLWGRPSDIEEGMRVVAALLTQPKVTQATLDLTIQTIIGGMKKRIASEPQLLGDAIVDAVFPADEARVRPPTPEQLLAVTPEQAQQCLEDHLARAPVEASIVGNISVDEAMRLAGGFLSVLPARVRVSESNYADRRRLNVPAYPLRRELTRAIEPGAAVVVVGFPGADASELAELRIMRVAARIFGDRAAAALKQNGFDDAHPDGAAIPGGTYSGFGVVACSIRAAPDRVGAAADTIEQVAREIAGAGVSDGEVQAAAGELIKAFGGYDRQPMYWSNILARLEATGVDLEEIADGVAFYRGLSAATVSAAVKRNVGEGRFLRVIIRSDKPENVADEPRTK